MWAIFASNMAHISPVSPPASSASKKRKGFLIENILSLETEPSSATKQETKTESRSSSDQEMSPSKPAADDTKRQALLLQQSSIARALQPPSRSTTDYTALAALYAHVQQQRVHHSAAMTSPMTQQHAPANLALLMGASHPYFAASALQHRQTLPEGSLFFPTHGKHSHLQPTLYPIIRPPLYQFLLLEV